MTSVLNSLVSRLSAQALVIRRSPVLFYALGLFVCCIPIIMRLAVICKPPFTDDGFYALHSMLNYDAITKEGKLLPLGVLQIYPILSSFIFAFDINHMLALRLLDMAIACIMAWLAYRLITQESDSVYVGFFISSMFVLAMNQELFIQRGFKNSIFVALVFLFISLRKGLENKLNSQNTWIVCGVFVGISICFREAFITFAIVGFFSILFSYGLRSSLSFVFGSVISIAIIISILAIGRGGFWNIVEAYSMFSSAAQISGKLASNSMLWFELTGKEINFLMPAFFLFVLGLVIGFFRKKVTLLPVTFWLAVSVAPLPEIVAKGGYGYHFAVCLVGLSGLFAYTFRAWKINHSLLSSFAVFIVFVITFLLAFSRLPHGHTLVTNIAYLISHVPQKDWPAEQVYSSHYLLTADTIRRLSKPNDTLETSGINFNVFVPSGLLPPLWSNNHLFDLGMTALAKNWSAYQLAEQIKINKTNIIFVSDRPGFGAEILKDAMLLLPEYTMAAYIPVDPSKDYGGFSGGIYMRQKGEP